MKYKSLAIITILVAASVQSQIYIGNENENVAGESTLLSFDDNPASNTKGIILPAVTSLPADPANGTFVFDTTNDENTIKMYEKGVWVELSEPGLGDAATLIVNNSNDEGEGTVIGDENSSPYEGVLVLESPDRAMILPKIANPELRVKSPYPGMMCYDTISKSLAVFDGTHWYFWR